MSGVTGKDGQQPDSKKQPSAVEPDHSAESRPFEPPRWYRRIDNAVFVFEAATVTATTALMTLFIFFDILFKFANGQQLRIKALLETHELGEMTNWTCYFLETAGVLEIGGVSFETTRTTFHLGELAPTTLVAVGVFTVFLGAITAHPWGKERTLPLRLLLALFGLSLFFDFVYIMLTAHPKVTCLVTAMLASCYVAVYLAKRKSTFAHWAIFLMALALFQGFCFTVVTERFSSWTHSYALVLLLWTCFIGASMATSKAKHLRIDAPRKAVPRRHMSRFNALSFLVAALFTGAFCYLSIVYFTNRMGGQTAEGEVPDWIKVLAIPVALSIVTLRFLFRSLWAALGYVEPLGEEVALPTTDEAEEAT